MSDPAASESSLAATPTAEVDAVEALGRVLTEEAAPLRDRAMLLISGLLTSEEDPSVTSGDGTVSIEVITSTRSIRVEIRDAGTGILLGGLRQRRGPRLAAGAHISSAASPIDGGLVSGAEGAWVRFELDLPSRTHRS